MLRAGPCWGQPTALLGIVLTTMVLVWPVLVNAFYAWSTNDDLSFGFLLAPVAGLLIWWRRGTLRQAASHQNSGGWLVVVVALGLYLLCQRLVARSPAAIAAGLLIWGEVIYLWGWRTSRLLAFPIGLVTFGLALHLTLIAPVAFVLQTITANGTALISQALGVPIIQEGLVLRTATFAFVVAEACSGMNSLLALLALAAVWISITGGPLLGRLAILVSVLPLVLVVNTVRVVLVVLVAVGFGQETALGFFHNASGLVLFGLACLGLLGVSRIARCRILVGT